MLTEWIREAPLRKTQGLFWHCPNGGGGSRPLPEWFGALILRRIVHVQRGICLFLGGLNPCQDGLGHLCSENWGSNAICSKCPKMKCPRVPVWVKGGEGGGVQSLFGQCLNRPCVFFSGASLRTTIFLTPTLNMAKEWSDFNFIALAVWAQPFEDQSGSCCPWSTAYEREACREFNPTKFH